MPLFTRCNIGLGCPQNVSVKFHFWGVSKKRADLKCIALNAKELHIPAPAPQESVTYTSFCFAYII